MELKIAKITPPPYSRFHFGQMKMEHDLSLSDTDSFCRSDTLFAGLVNSYAKVNESADDFVKSFQEEKIKISSLFYFIENQGTSPVYLLPKPAFLSLHVEKQPDGSHKKINQIEFVSKNVWDAGLKINEWQDESQYKIFQRKILLTLEEYKNYSLTVDDRIFEIHSMPKSPQTENSNEAIFYQTDVVLHSIKNATVGLYFMYQCQDKKDETALKNAANILAFSGFGGEINLIGRTLLQSPSFHDKLVFPSTGHHFSNVSLYSPKDATEFECCQYYETSLRGGRRKTHNNHTKVVRMVDEGALFTSNAVAGRIVDLEDNETGEGPILRYGIPLLIPVNL